MSIVLGTNRLIEDNNVSWQRKRILKHSRKKFWQNEGESDDDLVMDRSYFAMNWVHNFPTCIKASTIKLKEIRLSLVTIKR